jgi:hypothetical protein
MFLFFKKSHSYTVDRPVEQVQSKLRWIITRRWDDFSVDIIGRMTHDGRFNLTGKWNITPFKWIENSPGYIDGRLIPLKERTSIHITTKPNRFLVFLFYLATVLLVVEVSGLETFIAVERKIKVTLLVVVATLLLTAIVILQNNIRRSFEVLMQLR